MVHLITILAIKLCDGFCGPLKVIGCKGLTDLVKIFPKKVCRVKYQSSNVSLDVFAVATDFIETMSSTGSKRMSETSCRCDDGTHPRTKIRVKINWPRVSDNLPYNSCILSLPKIDLKACRKLFQRVREFETLSFSKAHSTSRAYFWHKAAICCRWHSSGVRSSSFFDLTAQVRHSSTLLTRFLTLCAMIPSSACSTKAPSALP